MKAKKIPIILVTSIIALIWCTSAWADRLNIRDYRQTQRIRQGIRSGEITRPEVRRLKNEHRHIYQAKHNNVRRRHAVVHRHNVNCYYSVAESVDAGGYAFSVGLSDIGWQFAFSGWSR